MKYHHRPLIPSPPMLAHAIRPAQLRALLLLLVLVPLVPTVLLLRLVADTAAGDRAAARARSEELYQQILNGSGNTLARAVGSQEQTPSAASVREFYAELFGSEISVSVRAPGDSVHPGRTPKDLPLAQTAVVLNGQRYDVRLYPSKDGMHGGLSPQARAYALGAGLLVCAILAIAAAAALAIHRQLTLEDLKSTAVATVAHELRTPMASIRMLVDTLREGRCRTAEQQQEYLDLIATELERLTRVTEQFLTHSRLERGQHGMHFTPVDPAELANSAVALLQNRLTAVGCHFSLQIFPDLALLHGDRNALVMVLGNLLENALKYTGAEKTITLRVRGASRAVLFEVMDNGIGMSAAETRSVFQPFRQADQRLSRSREGCGLGLSIVRQIVDAHGGRVTVDSRPARGSCFTIRLPALPKNFSDPKPATSVSRDHDTVTTLPG